MRKLLIICGPTATGKTALGVKLAKKFDGELISADSRQVYKYMDVGTGKDVSNAKFQMRNFKLQRKIQKEINSKISIGAYEIETIPIWGLDLVKPDQEFSVVHWVKFAHKIIKDIWKRKKLPILVGGTGFWIKALVDGVGTIGIPPRWEQRKKLAKLPLKELQNLLRRAYPERMRGMNRSDKNNPRRLIRAIEIATKIKNGKWKIENSMKIVNCKLKIDQLLIIGLRTSNQFLYQRIDKRVEKRIKQGAEKEVRNLVKKGYSWDLSSLSACGYKEWKHFLKGKAGLDQVIQSWKYNEHAYARRQMTFFKKIKNSHWFDIKKAGYKKDVVKLVKTWYDEDTSIPYYEK